MKFEMTTYQRILQMNGINFYISIITLAQRIERG